MFDNILYSRIDLSKTSYEVIHSARLMQSPNIIELQTIFKTYCQHKKFISVEPMWDNEFIWSHNDVIGYYDNAKLVAWSVVTKYNKDDVYSVQFAWDYANPELRLGIKSIEHECAYYKSQGYKYYYLGEAHKYKENFQGFEILNGYL
jgi:arginyl-tRNA--protein-N-Asp/Glu arginylyltransferase